MSVKTYTLKFSIEMSFRSLASFVSLTWIYLSVLNTIINRRTINKMSKIQAVEITLNLYIFTVKCVGLFWRENKIQ